MAHLYGSATSPSDLLDQIRAFLVLQGWTVDSFVTEAPGKRLHMHKGGFYFNAKSADTAAILWDSSESNATATQISFNCGTGYTSANPWANQPGVPMAGVNPRGAMMTLPPGAIVDFHFFYDDTYKELIVYVQRSAGIWRYLAFGESMVKAGAWTGGMWLFASANWYRGVSAAYAGGNGSVQCYPMVAHQYIGNAPFSLGFVRADVDAFTGKWISIGADEGQGKGGATPVIGYAGGVPNAIPWMNGLASHGANALNGLNDLFPLQIFAARDASPGGYSLLGSIPNVYLADITGLAVGAAYGLGANQYYPFPSANTHGNVIGAV